MRCRSSLDSKFLKALKGKRETVIILIALALGLLLLFAGRENSVTDPAKEEGLEERIAAACSTVDGVGECLVYIYLSPDDSRDKADRVESVIVVCEGADSVDVRLRLTEMLSSFFGIGTNRIRIEKMQS